MEADGRKDGGGAGEGEAEGYLKRKNKNSFDFELCVLMLHISFYIIFLEIQIPNYIPPEHFLFFSHHKSSMIIFNQSIRIFFDHMK